MTNPAPKYFDRTKLFRPGRFDLDTGKSKIGLAISIFGLLYGANMLFNGAIKPLYYKHFKPSTEQYVQCRFFYDGDGVQKEMMKLFPILLLLLMNWMNALIDL